jgi:alcohol dehydrogenase (NADP+)
MMHQLNFKNQDTMPALGLGTWLSKPGEIYSAIIEALKIGYRHFDCAHIYANESEIGTAFQDAFNQGLVQREDLWITSKLWCDAHQKEAVLPALQTTLRHLQLDYLDLYLIHWPVAYHQRKQKKDPIQFISLQEIPLQQTWEAMIELNHQGLCKHIGVSNFSIPKLQLIMDAFDIHPAMNQIELHPYLQQKEMLRFCKEVGIKLTAYSPLGSAAAESKLEGKALCSLLKHPQINNIAESHQASPAQVLIKWAIQRGTAVIPKSVNAERLQQNFDALKINLSSAEMQLIEVLDRHFRFVDGTFWTREEGPYTLENLWDEKA